MGFGAINIDTAGIGSILTGAGSLFKDIRTAITGKAPLDPGKMAELEVKMLETEQALTNAQIEVNKAEAASSSTFVAGWRPFVGWICACGLGMQYIAFPFASWLLPIIGHPEIHLPVMDLSELMPLLLGMLGLGALRTYEKVQNATSNH